MSDEKPTVVRIEYEYSDGTITRATGDDAATIARRIDSAFVMDYIHGGGYCGPDLEPVEREKEQSKQSKQSADALPVGPIRCPRCGHEH